MTIAPSGKPPFQARPLIGIALMLVALSCFTLLDTLAKKLTQTNPVMMVVWARYFFNVVLMALVLGPRMGLRLVRTQRPGLQAARGLILGLSSISFFSGLALMPLAEAAAISMIAPILLSVIAVLWLKEKAPRGTWLALLFSLSGVLLIIRPGSDIFRWAMVLPLISACCFAGYQLTTRLLSSSDDGLTTLFLGAVSATLLLSLIVPFHWHWPDSTLEVVGFVVMGAIGAFGHSLLIRAYRHATATRLAPFIYMQIVVALLLGWLVFGHFPDGLSLLGMGIVACSGLLLTLAGIGQRQR